MGMSLKLRQLTRIKDAGQIVVLRMNDGVTIEGIIVDLDENDICIRNSDSERLLSLTAIVDVQIRNVTVCVKGLKQLREKH